MKIQLRAFLLGSRLLFVSVKSLVACHWLVGGTYHKSNPSDLRIMVAFHSCIRLRRNIQSRFKPQTDRMCPSLSSSSFVCDICFEEKFHPVKLNNCSHYFCHPCIYQWAKSQLAADITLDVPTCPTCRQEFDIAPSLYSIGGKTIHRFNSFLGKNIPKRLGKMALAQVGFFYATTFCEDFENTLHDDHHIRCHYCQEEWNLSTISSLTDLQKKHSQRRPWCRFTYIITID